MAEPEKIPFCPGPNCIDNGTWYLVQGVNPAECTYCEFCVENGCVDREKIFKLPGPIKNCNCVCRGKHIYATSFVCPLCIIFSDVRSYEKRNCHDCKKPSSHKYYCDVCSYKQKRCTECSNIISSYDEYNRILSIITNDLVTKYDDPKYRMNYYVSMILTDEDIASLMTMKLNELTEHLSERTKKILSKYVGMSAEQIWQAIMTIKLKYQK